MRLRQAEPAGPPDILYHYTNTEGVRGIISSHHLWASNVRFLNDLSEPSFAASLIDETMDSVGRNTGRTPELVPNRQDYESNFPDVYAFCFCEQGDLLSQWRAYGDRGGGYAVGFDRDKLQKCLSLGQYLIRVNYEPTEQARKINDDYQAVVRAVGTTRLQLSIPSLPKSPSEEQRPSKEQLAEIQKKLRTAASHEMPRWQASFKNKAFEEEKEWRLVQFQPRGTKPTEMGFRVARGRIIPFMDLPFDGQLPIKKIIFGPTLDKEITTSSLRFFLDLQGYENVTIVPSNIPFQP